MQDPRRAAGCAREAHTRPGLHVGGLLSLPGVQPELSVGRCRLVEARRRLSVLQRVAKGGDGVTTGLGFLLVIGGVILVTAILIADPIEYEIVTKTTRTQVRPGVWEVTVERTVERVEKDG